MNPFPRRPLGTLPTLILVAILSVCALRHTPAQPTTVLPQEWVAQGDPGAQASRQSYGVPIRQTRQLPFPNATRGSTGETLFRPPVETTQQTQSRPRVGVVFGGGGAAGVCHVGVLKVLEEHGIPVDYIAGTSMGSIVAGLYATGRSTAELEHLVCTFPWDEVLVEPPEHDKKYERRKTDDYLFPPAITLGIDDREGQLGNGFVSGQNLTLQLRKLLANARHVQDFDQLPIPFRAVAVDLETGDPVVFRNGNLATAIRASMSIPGVFPPVQHRGRMLVDGGLINNLPTDIAREMGADILIVVQLPTHLKKSEEIKSLLSIASQSLSIVTANGPSNRAKGLRTGDILIRPDMNGISTLDFDRVQEAVSLGEAAAHQQDAQLAALSQHLRNLDPSVPPRRSLPIPHATVVEQIHIDNHSPAASHASIASRLSIHPGVPFALPQLERDIARIAGTGQFGTVDYEIAPSRHGPAGSDCPAGYNDFCEPAPASHGASETLHPFADNPNHDINYQMGQTLKVITTAPKGQTLLTLGLGFEDDFSGDASYSTSAALSFRGLNSLGGEARLFGQIGSRQRFLADFFQPLEPTQTYFARPFAEYRGRIQPLTLDQVRFADLSIRETRLGGELGRIVGDYGVIAVGGFTSQSKSKIRTGDPTVLDDAGAENDETAFYLTAKHDSLDSYFLPKHGAFAEATYTQFDKFTGATDSLFARVILAGTRGDHTLIFRGEALYDDVHVGERTDIQSTTGGFLRLTGYGKNEILSPRRVQGALVYMNRVRSLLGDRVNLYRGVSAEVAYFEGDGGNVVTNRPIVAGSAFVAADTPIGPLFAGYGMTDSDETSLFIAMGQVF